MKTGVHQSSELNPYLFSLVMDEFTKRRQKYYVIILCYYGDKNVPLKAQRKFYKAIVRSKMMYEFQC